MRLSSYGRASRRARNLNKPRNLPSRLLAGVTVLHTSLPTLLSPLFVGLDLFARTVGDGAASTCCRWDQISVAL